MTRWARGTQILHRFLIHGQPLDVRPVTVLADEADSLVLWLADGTDTMTASLAGGVDRRSVPTDELFGQPWQAYPHSWRNDVLMVLPRGAPYAVWSFFAVRGDFQYWYANLQSPYVRWRGGVDTVDHQLDLVVTPEHTVRWKDEDELAAAVGAGWFSAEDAVAFHGAAEELAAVAVVGAPPFDDGWHRLRPRAGLPVPTLPADWAGPGRPPAAPSRERSTSRH